MLFNQEAYDEKISVLLIIYFQQIEEYIEPGLNVPAK